MHSDFRRSKYWASVILSLGRRVAIGFPDGPYFSLRVLQPLAVLISQYLVMRCLVADIALAIQDEYLDRSAYTHNHRLRIRWSYSRLHDREHDARIRNKSCSRNYLAVDD